MKIRRFDPLTILVIVALALGWYGAMFLTEMTRSVLLTGLDEYFDTPTPMAFNSALFLMVTGGMIAAYYYIAPAVRNRGLRFLFSLPWPLLGVTIYILILRLVPVQGGGVSIGDVAKAEFWSVHFLLVPLYLAATAWISLLIMMPITFVVVDRLARKKREQHLDEAPSYLKKQTELAA